MMHNRAAETQAMPNCVHDLISSYHNKTRQGIWDDATDALLLHADAVRQLQGGSCKDALRYVQTTANNVATRSCTITHKTWDECTDSMWLKKD